MRLYSLRGLSIHCHLGYHWRVERFGRLVLNTVETTIENVLKIMKSRKIQYMEKKSQGTKKKEKIRTLNKPSFFLLFF